MRAAYKRHDMSDESWQLLGSRLPGRKSFWGGIAHDNRSLINAVCWIFSTGASWKDLPPSYGDRKNTNYQLCRWRDKGLWEKLLEALIGDPDFKWLMIGASAHIGRRGRQPGYVPDKRGLNSNIHLAVDAHGLPVRMLVTDGTVADCKQAPDLID